MTQPARPPAAQAYVFEARRDVVAIVEDYLVAMAVYNEQLDKLAKRIRPARAAGERRARVPLCIRTETDLRLLGYSTQGDETYNLKATVPEGWKLTKRGYEHVLVPAPTHPEGRKIAAAITKLALKCPIPLANQLPGMVSVVERQSSAPKIPLIITKEPPILWWDERHTKLFAVWHPDLVGKIPHDPKVWKPVWGSRFLRLQETGAITKVDA